MIDNQIDLWKTEISRLKEIATKRLHGLQEINAIVRHLIGHPSSPFHALHVRISHHKVRFDTGIVGIGTGTAKSISDEPLVDDASYTAQISVDYWPKIENLSTTRWFEPFRSLLAEYWSPQLREKFGLFEYQQPGVRVRLMGGLVNAHEAVDRLESFAVFIDLDKFKALNDQEGYPTADSALKDVCAAVELLGQKYSLIGFNTKGGDEFGIVASGTLYEVFQMMEELRSIVTSQEYGANRLRVGFTAGIVKLPNIIDFEIVDAAFNLASEQMGEVVAGVWDKKRGVITYVGEDKANAATALTVENYLRLGVAVAWAKQAVSQPFSNIYLNLISRTVARTFSSTGDNLDEQVGTLIGSFGIKIGSAYHEADLIGPQSENIELSMCAIAPAILHGLIIAERAQGIFTSNRTIACSSDWSQIEIRNHNNHEWGHKGASGVEVLVAPLVKELPEEVALIWSLAIKIGFMSESTSIKIDDFTTSFCQDTVIIDDRPKSGGGLPDFWQAAVAHTYSVVARHPGITTILVFGEADKARETLSRLTGEVELNIDELAGVTMVPQALLRDCAKRVKADDVIRFISSDTALINAVYNEIFKITSWEPLRQSGRTISSPKMKRRLDETGLALRPMDGVRCSTAAHAYPLIVEILRTSEPAVTYDDASQTLSEIVGFKLALDKPNSEPIPEYWLEQQDAFDNYANTVLLEKESLIGRHLYADGQFDAFIDQLASYFHLEDRKRSTRRAILIVPNVISSGVMKPLGLVSVWATPRYVHGDIKLEFCFVWRTVEVLVGLPYSLYGSVKFSEHICAQIEKKLSGHSSGLKVSTGGLTYLALSLHMRVDEFHQRIAKRIVDAGSV